MRAGVLLLAFGLTGCGMIFGLDEPRLVDAGPTDSAMPDLPIDAALVLGCPDVFLPLPTSGGTTTSTSRYYREVTARSFLDAAAACAAFPTTTGKHTHLVVLSDDAELSAVRQTSMTGDTSELWIGLSSIVGGKYQWVTAENVGMYPPSTGAPWAFGEPTGGTEHCVAIRNSTGAGGTIEDLPCSTTLSAVCECDDYADDPSRY